jgi:hypothetical protein
MEDVRFSESSMNFYQSTRSHIPEMVLFMATADRNVRAAL